MAKAPDVYAYFLKPAPDRRVRRQDGVLLADDGETVARSPYWDRKLFDEDVVEAEPPKPAKPTSPGAE